MAGFGANHSSQYFSQNLDFVHKCMYEQSVTTKLLVYADDIQLHCFLIMDLKFFKVIFHLGSTSRIWFSKIGFFINKIKLINTFELH